MACSRASKVWRLVWEGASPGVGSRLAGEGAASKWLGVAESWRLMGEHRELASSRSTAERSAGAWWVARLPSTVGEVVERSMVVVGGAGVLGEARVRALVLTSP